MKTSTVRPDVMLRRVLQANAWFSLASGLILLLAAQPLSEFGGVEPVVLRVVGAGLIPWGVIVFRIASRSDLRHEEVRAVIVADLAWVVGTIVVAIAASSVFTAAGLVVLMVLGVIVADFAAAQFVGLRRARAAEQ